MNNINEIIVFIQKPWVQAIAVIGSIIGGLWVFVDFWNRFGDKIISLCKGVIKTMTKPFEKNPLQFETPEGQIPLDSPFYVERPPIESDCYKAIINPDALIRIKAPRQMGKTSLTTRILNHAKENGCQGVTVYFQQAESEIFANLDQFLQWFCAVVTQELNMTDKIDEFWKGRLGSKMKASNYFQKYLLAERTTPLVLGLDEVDMLFQYPKIAEDFLALLRAWHERGKTEEIWQRLRLVLNHSQEVYIPLNINQSPFNVGLPVDLPELNKAQTLDLAKRHELEWSESEIEEIMNMLGGHPYLLRVAMYDIARKRMTLENLLKISPTEHGLYADHLRRHLSNLKKDDKLLNAMKQVIAVDTPVKVGDTETFKLRSMGLIRFAGNGNTIIPLCDLYRLYFRDRL